MNPEHEGSTVAGPNAAEAATQQQQDTRLPFRYGVRQSVAPLVGPQSAVAFAAGGDWSFQLNKVGAANAVLLTFVGVWTSAGGHVRDYRTPWNIIGNTSLGATVGSTELLALDGWGLNLAVPTYRGGFRLDGDSRIYSRPPDGANAGVPVRVSWLVPIAMNDGEQFEIGALLLQTPDVEVNLSGKFAALADLGTNMTSLTGTLTAAMVYYEMGSPQKYRLPRLSLSRWRTDRVAINGTGEVRFRIPRFGTVHQMVFELTINGASSDAWDKASVVFNKTAAPYTFRQPELRMMEAKWYEGYVPPVGVAYLDFYQSYGRVNTGDLRDALDPEELAEMEVVFNIPQGTVLGANNNFLTARTHSSQILGG